MRGTESRMMIGVLAVLAVVMAGCTPHGAAHYRANGAYQSFDFTNDDNYRDYQDALHKELTSNWLDLFATDSNYIGRDVAHVPAIVDRLMPTDAPPVDPPENGGRRRSMLLLHGLYDSPYGMHDLEQYFRKQGFYTRSMLLPGHGTRPGNLLKIDREEWIKAVDFGVRSLRREIGGDVYIAGFSNGGALALRQALVHPESVNGLFLFAPAIEVPSQASQRIFNLLGFRWMPFQKLADRDFASYESATLDAAIEVSRLGREVQALLDDHPLEIPVMIVAAENDYSIRTEVTRTLFEDRQFGEKSRMFIYAPVDRGPAGPDAADGGTPPYQPIMLNSRFQYTMAGRSYQIADYSHMALTLKPDDPHYGLAGNYQYCHHYFLWPGSAGRRGRCAGGTTSEVCHGERKMIGATSYSTCKKPSLVRRLTSNPGFDELEREMSVFIDQYIGSVR